MTNTLFFVGIQLAIFWVMWWAWKQDNVYTKNESTQAEKV